MALKCLHDPKRKKNCRGGAGAAAAITTGVCSFLHSTGGETDWHRGLDERPRRAAPALLSLQSTVHALEERVRAGDTAARHILSGLTPAAAAAGLYGALAPARHALDISFFPNISSEVIVATLPAKQHEDTFISFLRGSVPVLNNYKKIHRDVRWPEEHAQSAVLLLVLCMPTLLSLFPCRKCKDVNFALRVRIFCEIRALLQRPHAARAEFISQNKSTLRLCLVEYAMFVMESMPVLPLTPSRQNRVFELHFRAANNMGQHFRVDINSLAPHAPADAAGAVWHKIRDCAQVLYDRYVRVCKTSDRGARRPLPSVSQRVTTCISQTQIRSTLHRVFNEHAHNVSRMPLMNSFDIAEMYMRRVGIPLKSMSVLWDCRNYIRFHPLPAPVVRAQVRALARVCRGDTILMHNRSHLLVCTFCLTQNVVTAFRFDSLNHSYVCNRCEVPSATVDIDMLGRIVYIREIPLLLCSLCSEIVVWSGTSVEVSHHARQASTDLFRCQCMHISWGMDMNINSLQNLVQNCSHGQFILRNTQQTLPPRRIMHFHPDLTIDDNPAASSNHCSLCRTANIFFKKTLLNTRTCVLVDVQTCYRHTVQNNLSKFSMRTVADFIRLQKSK